MKKFALIPLLLGFSSCTLFHAGKDTEDQATLTMNKLRTDIEEVKHELNSYEIDHHILEGKLLDQEQLLTSVRSSIGDISTSKLPSSNKKIHALHTRLDALEKKIEQTISDVHRINEYVQETNRILHQIKTKSSEKKPDLSVKDDKHVSTKKYRVESGDSLEKVAKRYDTSVEELKKLNQIQGDRIVVGQTLLLP